MASYENKQQTNISNLIYLMRKIVLSALALCCCSVALAQEKTRSLSVELFGAQNLVGINYDSRFKGNSGLGYRVGIGYGYGDNSSWVDQKISGVGVPLELNYLLGEKKSKLEVGLGASLGVYHIKETSWYYYQPVPPETTGRAESYESKETRFGYFFFGNIGYRYQRTNGFIFRVGVSPSFNFGDKHGLSKPAFYPYVGLGWSF